jgi:hypothetical protein
MVCRCVKSTLPVPLGEKRDRQTYVQIWWARRALLGSNPSSLKIGISFLIIVAGMTQNLLYRNKNRVG